jgi:hypothetical protein
MGPKTGYLVLTAALALAPLGAEAQSYRCVGKDGKKYYGSAIPPQCVGQPIEQLNAQGNVMRRIDPATDEKSRGAKEAEAAKKKQDETAQREERRRNQALLATYTSVKDIDDARSRALAENEKQMNDAQAKIADIKKRQAGKGQDAKMAEIDMRAQESLLESKRKDVQSINARYDEDKRRFIEINKNPNAPR